VKGGGCGEGKKRGEKTYGGGDWRVVVARGRRGGGIVSRGCMKGEVGG